MAVHGFSIFIGFFPIAIFTLIFIMLFSFKRFREEFRIYYDALFCGCTAVKLSLYYIAFNYPENSTSTGGRNLLMCILIMVIYLGFHTASLGFLTAGGFWHMIRARVRQEVDKPKAAGPSKVRRGSQTSHDEPKTVRFVKTVEDPTQERFFKNLNNKIILSIVVFTFMIPVLYILIDIFKGSDANIIHDHNRCWIGRALMYVFMFTPLIIAIIATVAMYIRTGISIDSKIFFKLRPHDRSIRNIQLRVLFVVLIGLWWLIQHPVLQYETADITAVQYMNGILLIPLGILAFYVFVCETDDIFEAWDAAVPIGGKIRRTVMIHWKYDVQRPVQKKLNRMKVSHNERGKYSEEASVGASVGVENDYDTEIPRESVEYDDHEFQPPVEYDNEGQDNAIYEGDSYHEDSRRKEIINIEQESPEYIEPLPVSDHDSPQYDNTNI